MIMIYTSSMTSLYFLLSKALTEASTNRLIKTGEVEGLASIQIGVRDCEIAIE